MKASDFLVGLRDLFAFVVPGGAFLLFFPAAVACEYHSFAQLFLLRPENDTIEAFLLFFAAYAVGAILSGIGSAFDGIAERFVGAMTIFSVLPFIGDRKHDLDAEFRRLRELAKRLELHALEMLPEKPNKEIFGSRSFWWNYLRTHHPAAVGEVDRLEAQQKMFRSLSVAGILLFVVHGLSGSGLLVSGAFLIGAIASFVQYAGVRTKTARRIYQLAVVLFVPANLASEFEQQKA